MLRPDLPAADKQRLAREIAGMLFSAEANTALCNRARILFLRLRTQAHLAAGAARSRDEASIWSDYEELESLLPKE